MPSTLLSKASLAALALALSLVLSLAIRPGTPPHPLPASRMSTLPPITLWAWERREDLRSLASPQDIRRYAIAYLDQTLTIGLGVSRQPRRDPVAFPAASTRIPVIRIEAPRQAVLDPANRAAALDAILSTAREPDIAALQLDFDATRSQRAFYRDLLIDLRRAMPPHLPLSITALASWCSYDDWLSDLPIDEAVPMFFRMEPDRRRASPSPSSASPVDDFRIREPLCRASYGLSTREPWPSDLAHKRLYIFPENGWRQDLPPLQALLPLKDLPSLERSLP